jgi:uncharacterized protein YdeI (YjbR/CyaY-like superfamily)
MEPVFFTDSVRLRAWLRKNHASERELWVGLYRKGTGRRSITWPELVDQLLCFGWIDGVRKTIDDESWMIRVTPRKPGSTWSAVNLRRARELIEQGLMEAAGRAVHDARDEAKTERYSFERKEAVSLGDAFEAEFRSNRKAWTFFQSQPPSYRRTATWWVISAKREDTRRRRLAALIRDSSNGERIGPLRR